MTRLLLLLLATSLASPLAARHQDRGEEEAQLPASRESADPHAGHERRGAPREQAATPDPQASHAASNRAAEPRQAPPPAEAFSGPAHAADLLFDKAVMAQARNQLRDEEGGLTTRAFLADRFETRIADGDEHYLWDLQGWYGGDINRVWLKTEGEGGFGNSPDEVELQALYSRAITPFFDIQAGLRHDARPDPDRSHLVVGLQGLLPYVFEVDAAAFLSEEGDLTGRLEAEYDLQINQRLILQPRVELNLAARDVPELRLGSGISSVEAGIRLRYEILREFAPYIGVGWQSTFGDTADFARAAGEDRRSLGVVLGVRTWF